MATAAELQSQRDQIARDIEAAKARARELNAQERELTKKILAAKSMGDETAAAQLQQQKANIANQYDRIYTDEISGLENRSYKLAEQINEINAANPNGTPAPATVLQPPPPPTEAPAKPSTDTTPKTIEGGSDSTVDKQTAANAGDEDPFERERLAAEERYNTSSADGVVTPTDQSSNDAATATATTQEKIAVNPFIVAKDWRVRLSLAPGAKYLYKADNPGILAPLIQTGGVLFPYTPSISVTYAAHYDPQDLVHSNYKSYAYKNSSVDQISINADFTAQSTSEANYLLAVIHFLRSASKMFYGQDSDPPRGTPPPLLYLSGYGAYQFDNHPVALTSFTYALPTDVDYISASISTDASGSSIVAPLTPNENISNAQNGARKQNPIDKFKSVLQRLSGSGLQPGAKPGAPVFTSNATINDATRVPTKIQLQLQFIPIVTRDAMSNAFSLKAYATGQLLRGSKNAGTGGGIW